MSDLSDRLKQLAREKRVSTRELERIMHVANGYVCGIGETMGADKVENILQRFPDVSRDWLLFGEGEMLKDVSNMQIGSGNVNHQGNTTNTTTNNYQGFCEQANKRNDDVIVKMLETLTEQGKRHLDIIDNAIAHAKELEEIKGILRQVLDKIDEIDRNNK